MLLHVSVILSTGVGHVWWGTCVAGGVHGGGGMHGRGACMAGGMRGKGTCVAREVHGRARGMHGRGSVHGVQERWTLKRVVRILMECILVFKCQRQRQQLISVTICRQFCTVNHFVQPCGCSLDFPVIHKLERE